MKKFLFTISSVTILCLALPAQNNSIDKKEEDFDKKFRFGLRATPQPTWYKSNNTVSVGNGSNFGFGFGLTMEFKLSNIIHFQTGIGGDFEGGIISYRNDANTNVKVVLDKEDVMVEAKQGISNSEYDLKPENTSYILKERKYKTTMVSIPLLLKMMTQEYSGLRYFAMFGGEIGFRAGIKANDTYYSGLKAVQNGTTVSTVPAESLTKENILVSKDASLIPARVGMNLGLGTEYRIAGSTSLVFSVNYFQSFTNLMRKESKYLTKAQTYTGSGYNFMALNQNYLMRAIRINIGIMF